MAEKYNGWTNYETWLVNLWLDNGGSGEHWREYTEEHVGDGAERDDAVDHIADQIKAEHDEALAEIIPGASGVFQDLLSASLRAVNWHEIAAHYVDDAMAEAEA